MEIVKARLGRFPYDYEQTDLTRKFEVEETGIIVGLKYDEIVIDIDTGFRYPILQRDENHFLLEAPLQGITYVTSYEMKTNYTISDYFKAHALYKEEKAKEKNFQKIIRKGR